MVGDRGGCENLLCHRDFWIAHGKCLQESLDLKMSYALFFNKQIKEKNYYKFAGFSCDKWFSMLLTNIFKISIFKDFSDFF